MEIQDRGCSNSQVTEAVKEQLYEYLGNHDVERCREAIHFHHYNGGEFVAMSVHGSLSNLRSYNAVRRELLKDSRNRSINDDTVWIHRDWIRETLF